MFVSIGLNHTTRGAPILSRPFMFVSIKSTNIQDDELWSVTTHGFDLDGALILSTYCLLLIASLYD